MTKIKKKTFRYLGCMLLSFFPSLVARTQFTRCTEWVVSTQLITFRWRRQKRWDQMIATRADTHCQWVWVTISGLIAKTKQAAIAVLMSSGIQAEERWWDEAEFSIHRRQSGRIEQTKFIVQAIPNERIFEGPVCPNGF